MSLFEKSRCRLKNYKRVIFRLGPSFVFFAWLAQTLTCAMITAGNRRESSRGKRTANGLLTVYRFGVIFFPVAHRGADGHVARVGGFIKSDK
jgi:hypothetical protein